ncbi:MAG TPA: hypothetical protein ENH72_13375 [Pseudomonas sabulinigri]|jgi:hypothetical protein|uniref:ATPase n=1 Tax=marine sediment metagenome TaxID=412755 RepID=A0A0F9SVM0_9ZZZZ|nr:hypothetical protein [Halopseudomonas sabulinigri]HEC52475.1 hypothetical protein [Halopseudomonas sabulinigri]|tara:strand:+ start:1000 stop:1461 length:462 start_codon:yes stop_codon:yes gene_type:complete
MKAETYRELIEWTQHLHGQLASRMEAGAAATETTERMRWLLEYLADHERCMQQMVVRFEEQADINVLDSWVYDHFTNNPRTRALDAGQSFAGMSYEGICATVFDLHNDALDLYRYLEGRAETAAGRELMQDLLAMEQHETLRLAEQAQRVQEM